MVPNINIIVGMFFLSTISGMLGLGVAFAAIPFLGLFFTDLVYQVQPLSLFLNGFTALFSAIGFSRSGLVKWNKAISLSIVTTIAAPMGSCLAQVINPNLIWVIYLSSAAYLAYRLFKPTQAAEAGRKENFRLAMILAVPISILSGLLGVGPGFLLMPTLILAGFNPKKAAGINAFAVTLPSFSALIPRFGAIQFDPGLTITLVVVGSIGSFIGAKITSIYVPGVRIKQIFAILIVVVTLYKVYTVL